MFQRGGNLMDRLAGSVIESPSLLLEQALEARERGNLAAAFWLLDECYREDPNDADTCVAFWDVAVHYERFRDAVPAVVHLIESAAGEGNLELASQYWLELLEHDADALVRPSNLIHILSVLQRRAAEVSDDAAREPLQAAVQRTLAAMVDERNEGLSTGLALHLAEVARELDPDVSLAAARIALASNELHDFKRTRMQELIGELEEIPEVFAFSEARTPSVVADVPGGVEPAAEAIEESALLEPLTLCDLGEGGEGEEELPFALIEEEPVCEVGPPAPEDESGLEPAVPVEIKVMCGQLTDLRGQTLFIDVAAGRTAQVPFDKIEGISVAQVGPAAGIGPLIVDLLLNLDSREEEPLRSVRLETASLEDELPLESDDFGALSMQDVISLILDDGCARPLPSSSAVLGYDLQRYDSVEAYESAALQV